MELIVLMERGDGPAITAAMEKRGWIETRTRRIMGENWVRILGDVGAAHEVHRRFAASLSLAVSQANSAGRNQARPLNSGTAAGGRKSSADSPLVSARI